jgi:hypothetical protein
VDVNEKSLPENSDYARQTNETSVANESTPDDLIRLDEGKSYERENAITKIKLGLVIPSNEFTPENINYMRNSLISRRSVTFCAEQFKNDVIRYEIIDVNVIPESTASLFEETISDDYELNSRASNPNAIYIAIDIGGGSSDFAAMQGVEIIPASEKVYNIGVNDALLEIAQQVERKFNLESGYLDATYVDNVVRYPVAFCGKCGTVSKSVGSCNCGGEYQLKKNIMKVGSRSFDISDIVEYVYDEKADWIAEFCKRYVEALFRSRGISKTQLDTIFLVGGGAEIFGERLKTRIRNCVGDFVDIIKTDKASWKALNGVSKYVMFKEKRALKDYDRYVFVDPGNTNTKAKCLSPDGEDIVKPIVMITKTATPLPQINLSIKKINPMMDLDLKIASENGKEHLGNGHYFVSHLANKGKNPKTRDFLVPKHLDEMTYIMINSAVGVILARDRAKKAAK